MGLLLRISSLLQRAKSWFEAAIVNGISDCDVRPVYPPSRNKHGCLTRFATTQFLSGNVAVD